MSFAFPFTGQVVTVTQAVDSVTKRVQNRTSTTGATIPCDLQRRDSSQMFEKYGLKLNNPAELYVPISYASSFRADAKFICDGDTWFVRGDPVPRKGTGRINYCLILLEGMQYS